MNPNIALPGASEIEAYFRNTGWRILGTGPIGRMWGLGEASIAIPFGLEEDLAEGILKRIAVVEQRPKDRVLRAIKYRLFDVTYFRAINDEQIVDAIPINDASRIITDARNMLRASATTARRERAQIAGNYAKAGDDVIRDTLMGHTERGSFIIPVMVPIAEPGGLDEYQPQLGDDLEAPPFYQTQPEPFERRVVRTFAQSLQALSEVVVATATEPTATQVHELIYRGVSREFCTALSNILRQRSVAEVETRVEWGSAIQPPGMIPESILIPSDSSELIDLTARKLQHDRRNIPRTLSGPIVQFRCNNDDYGVVSVSTVYRGRQTEVDVRLSISAYEEAWTWHRAGRAVVVQGTVERGSRRKSEIANPTRFHPLDEMTLPDRAANDAT